MFAAGRFDAAFEAASQSLDLASKPMQRIQARRSRGAILYQLGRLPEALADYEAAAIPFTPEADAATTLEIAKSHLGKALTLYQLNRKPDADALIEALDHRFADTRDEALALVVAEALNALAYQQREAGQFREAIATVRRMQERFGGGRSGDVELKRLLASSELTLALSLGEAEGPESERLAYLQLRQRFQNETDGDIKATVSYALYNTGLVYERLNQKEAAREVYLQIERDYQGESLPALVTTVRDARQRLRALGAPPERPAAPPSDR
jgi:tetratricopeptide (TPR) repeat protein